MHPVLAFPAEGRDPFLPWAPAFAGVAEILFERWCALPNNLTEWV